MTSIEQQVFAILEKKLSQRSILINELSELEEFYSTSTKVDVEIANTSGHKTPFYIWTFPLPVFHALAKLSEAGKITFRMVTKDFEQAVQMTGRLPRNAQLMTNPQQQAPMEQQHWLLLRIVLGMDKNGGRFIVKKYNGLKIATKFEWYAS